MAVSSVKTGVTSISLLAGNAAFIPSDFESIATAYGNGSSDTITLSSIPSTYTHLQLRIFGWASGASAATIQFNGGGTYSDHYIYGTGATAAAAADTSDTVIRANIRVGGGTANTYGTAIIDLLDYANTNKYKTIRSLTGRDENGSGIVSLASGLYQSTTAISSITIVNNASTGWTTASSFALYGIK
jgi:hypothetical protein